MILPANLSDLERELDARDEQPPRDWMPLIAACGWLAALITLVCVCRVVF